MASRFLSHVYVFGFALVYTLGYIVLAIAASGAGHGTFIFFAPLFTWIFVLVSVYLSGRPDSLFRRIFFVTCMSVHYLHVLIFLRPLFVGDLDAGTENTWQMRNGPQMIFFIGAWYLAGQIVIWFRFIRSLKTSRSELPG